jgi:adenylate cyclase
MPMSDDNIFSVAENKSGSKVKESWKVLIVDDDADIHDVTKFILKNFEFEKKKLHFISAYSAEEAKKLINEHPDTALILLDIVMEDEDAGLKFVKYLREDLHNNAVRIILSTGQPGVAPQTKVVIDYDINDYKEKTELTKEKFFSAVVIALRSFEILRSMEISIHTLQSSSKAAERFIMQDYLKILNKKSIAEVQLGDHAIQEMTVLFMDISTLITSHGELKPDQNVQLINSFMEYLDPVIIEQKGFIDTFISNAIMSLFYGPPDNAIRASISIIKGLNTFNKTTSREQLPLIRIGIHTGILTLGIVGSEEKLDCTALGETVNFAVHLENLNNHYRSNILVGEDTIKKLARPKDFHYRWIANLVLHEDVDKPKISVYEVFDVDPESVMQLKESTKTLFEDALKNYIENDHENAKKKFNEVVKSNSQDEIAKLYLNILSEK